MSAAGRAGPAGPAGPATTVDDVVELYARRGADPYDEQVAQLDHALQTAALAVAEDAADALVAAALLHDVGHLLHLDGGSPGPHERTGPRYLERLFPRTVIVPIALHVRAKRYLCAVETAYAAGLSAGSRRSLGAQGGPLGPDEVAAFEATAGWHEAVTLRRWDDAGKRQDLDVAGIGAYRSLLAALVRPAT
jgi:predicted HD phosphohydrolase